MIEALEVVEVKEALEVVKVVEVMEVVKVLELVAGSSQGRLGQQVQATISAASPAASGARRRKICLWVTQRKLMAAPAATILSLGAMVEKQVDEATHTGQQWSADDIRSARFMNRTKQACLKS